MEKGPWSTIWRNPRETIQYLVDTQPRLYFFPLIILGGIAQTLGNATAIGDMLPFSALLLACILSGPLSGLFTVYVGGFVLHRVSQRLGGLAPLEHIRTVIVWSWAPFVYTLPLWGVKYILFRNELFLIEKPFIDSQPVLSGLFDFMTMVDFAVFVFYLYILFTGLSQVNKFSMLKSIGSWVLMSLVLGIPMLLILYLLGPIVPK